MNGPAEQVVIDQLKNYRRLVGKIETLSRYPIGFGMSILSTNEDDRLQELHHILRGMPSNVYLNKSERELEAVAIAYLTNFPLGTRSQIHEIKNIHAVDEEDDKKLKLLAYKISNVLDARGRDGFTHKDYVKRISELQELHEEKQIIDNTLEVMEGYEPSYAVLLRKQYLEGGKVAEVALDLGISRKTYDRRRYRALMEYAHLAGLTH